MAKILFLYQRLTETCIVLDCKTNQRTLGGTHGAKSHFKDDIHHPLKNRQTAKNEISIIMKTLAKLSFARALLFVISVSVKWRGNLSVSEFKYKLKMKGVLFPSLINGSKPKVQNPDIAIEINPFIVKLFM